MHVIQTCLDTKCYSFNNLPFLSKKCKLKLIAEMVYLNMNHSHPNRIKGLKNVFFFFFISIVMLYSLYDIWSSSLQRHLAWVLELMERRTSSPLMIFSSNSGCKQSESMSFHILCFLHFSDSCIFLLSTLLLPSFKLETINVQLGNILYLGSICFCCMTYLHSLLFLVSADNFTSLYYVSFFYCLVDFELIMELTTILIYF